MAKKQVILIIIALASLLIGIVFFEIPSGKPKLGQVIFPEAGLRLQVEIAETQKQRAQGLMLRRFLGLDKGMLFIFAQEDVQRVWMKNTLINLDVVFLSGKGVVVSIIQGLKPCLQNPCKVYGSNKKAKYMLEMNAGVIKKAGIFVGQRMIFDN